MPVTARRVEDLPTPLRPSTAVMLSRLRLDGDVLQRLRGAVVEVDGADRES